MSGTPEGACNTADLCYQPATCLVTVAGSAGAFEGLLRLVAELPRQFGAALAIVMHTRPGSHLASALAVRSRVSIRAAASGDLLQNGAACVAPPRAHLIVNPDARVSVSEAPARRGFRPSADWLLESASATFGDRHIAVILSGMMSDGAEALVAVKRSGGMVIVQDPREAAYPEMPESAIATGRVDLVVSASRLADTLSAIVAARDAARDLHAWEAPFDIAAA